MDKDKYNIRTTGPIIGQCIGDNQHVSMSFSNDPPKTQQEESFVKWQERMVHTILQMHDRGNSENQIRFWFGEQCDKRKKGES